MRRPLVGAKPVLAGLLLVIGTMTAGVVNPQEVLHKPLEGKVILLDPGHAVKDASGAVVNPGSRTSPRRKAAGPGGKSPRTYERDVVLNVAETMVPLLEAQGAKVFLTRTRDNPWRYSLQKKADNRARAILANLIHADAYIRIHCDWNRDRRFKGFTTYYYRWGSRGLAKSLHTELEKMLTGHRDNGIHRRSLVSVTARMPAVLVEMGVLSNRQEGEQLGDPAFQTSLAMSLVEGIVNYFGNAGAHGVRPNV